MSVASQCKGCARALASPRLASPLLEQIKFQISFELRTVAASSNVRWQLPLASSLAASLYTHNCMPQLMPRSLCTSAKRTHFTYFGLDQLGHLARALAISLRMGLLSQSGRCDSGRPQRLAGRLAERHSWAGQAVDSSRGIGAP